jgi:hypothetical protein
MVGNFEEPSPLLAPVDSARFCGEKNPNLGAALIAEVQDRIRFAVQLPEALRPACDLLKQNRWRQTAGVWNKKSVQ